MDFDTILEHIGEFGLYQRTNYLLICLPVMFAAANSLSYVFTAGLPTYRCFIPECEFSNSTEVKPIWLSYAVPGQTDIKGTFTPEHCLRFVNNIAVNTNETDTCTREYFLTNETEHCSEWIFDPYEHTIVQEWKLTCSKNTWKLAFVGTMHFAGLVIGTALSGYLADRYGRKKIFILCIVFMSITGIGQGLAWNYNSFLVFALLNAIGTSGVYPLAFIIGVEMVGPRMREATCIVLNYFYAIGEALVGLLAWTLQDWHLLQYALSVPPIFFIAYFWLVPESVRWLLARNEKEKAKLIIKRVAAINKRKLTNSQLDYFSTENDISEVKPAEKKFLESEIWISIKQICQCRKLLCRYFIMLYLWIVNAVVFYGLSLNSTNLSGNKFLNFSLVCLIEIPGYSLAWICLRKFGRRYSLSGSLFLCAFTCVLGGYITKASEWIIITLFLLGKLGITSSFAVVYTYSAEMMPTIIRSGGVGLMSTFARFGAMIAPFIPLLGFYYEALPLLIFGAAAFTAGTLAFFLPETFHKKLPDTVQEAMELNKIVNE